MEVTVLFSNGDYYGVVNHETTRKLLNLPWKLPGDTKQGWYGHVTTTDDVTSTCAQAQQIRQHNNYTEDDY